MFSKLLLIVAIFYPSMVLAQSPYANDESFRPSEGIWWSSEEPGTGVGFNMDSEGRWFAALYLYDEDGRPTFLTMQGEALEYFEQDQQPYPSPWAIAESPLILSQGGQCLTCPWSRPAVSDTGVDAQIRFFGRNRAELKIGDWSLQLTPLTVRTLGPFDPARPVYDRHYLFTGALEPGGLAHVAVVRLPAPQGGGFLGAITRSVFECIQCRSLDANGSPNASVDAELEAGLESLAVICGPGPCRLSKSTGISILYVDKSGRILTAVDPTPAPAGTPPNVIKLQLLEAGWRP